MYISRRYVCHAVIGRSDFRLADCVPSTKISCGDAHFSSTRSVTFAGPGPDNEGNRTALEHYDENYGIPQIRDHAQSRLENHCRTDPIRGPEQYRLNKGRLAPERQI